MEGYFVKMMLYNSISFEPFLQEWLKCTYLCSVFFIVLDLRLTKVGLSGALFLIAPILRRFIVFPACFIHSF